MRQFFATVTNRLGQLPRGFIGGLVLVLMVESLIARHPLGTLTSIQFEYAKARVMATGRVNDCPILTFGDSMMKLGISPTTLQAATGRPTYNFALTATQAPAFYYLLKRAIDSGARPAAVVLEAFPRQLAEDPAFNVEHWPLLLDPAELYELSAGHGDWRLLSALGLKYLVPSIRSVQAIRHRVPQAFAGTIRLHLDGMLVGFRNWEANRGFQLNEYPGGPIDIPTWRDSYFQFRTIHPTNRDYIERFLNLADQHAITVFWLLPPYRPAMQADCEQTGFDQYHEKFVRRQMARHPRLRVIDGRHSNYDPNVFVDPHHLTGPGALVLSAEIGAVLRRFFEDPRSLASSWVTLSPYQVKPSIVAVETLDQSRQVLIDTGVIRR